MDLAGERQQEIVMTTPDVQRQVVGLDEKTVQRLIKDELDRESPDWRRIEALSRGIVDVDPDSVRFKVDAGHIQRLGVELVGKADTAVSELIKNAFDADAKSVTLTFTNASDPGGTLIIEDDGSGMTDEVVRSSWMRISTPSKYDEPMSPLYGRTRAGRKGIGRFSAQRLGKRLQMETRSRGLTHGYKVEFHWDADFNPGVDLNEVFSQITRFEKAPDDCGTKLEICDLREGWSEAALLKVWRSVLLLQPPFPLARPTEEPADKGDLDPGFSVTINGSTRDEKRTEFSIEKSFLTQAIATISATVDENGKARVEVISEKLALNDWQYLDEKMLVTGKVSLNASYFIYAGATLSGMSVNAAAEMGRKFGGVRIYRNGFRVLPYGEAWDDWLGLDADVSRRELLIPSNNRNYFGHLELDTRENPFFEETSSREGLLENTAYMELRRFVRSSLVWAAMRVAAARNRKTTASQKDFKAEPRKPSEAIRDLMGGSPIEVTAASTVPAITQQALARAEAIASEYEQQVEKERAASLEYEQMLRLLASLGLSISVFGHEVKGSRDALQATLDLLSDAIEEQKVDGPESALSRRFALLRAATDRMFDIGGYIAGMMSTTESRTLRSLSVKGVLDRFVAQFSEYMSKQQVEFNVDVQPEALRTTLMHRSEFESVLLNFLTNSIKAMRKGRVKPRRVKLDARADGPFVVVGFEDNGPGVALENRDRVFDAFFTTSMAADDDGVQGPGTGLGLKIVADIASSYGGSASLAEPSPGYGCRFEFRVLAAGGTK